MCGAGAERLDKFLDLGSMPHAGGFLRSPDAFATERSYPLATYFCRACALVQVLDVVPKETLFTDYFYSASASKTVQAHADAYAATLAMTAKDALVVEIGSNDGVLLEALRRRGVRAVGVEPAQNIGRLATERSLVVLNAFFNEMSARQVLAAHGQADIITGSNVMAHIDDVDEVLRAAGLLLKPHGSFVLEAHHLLSLVAGFQYDVIYNEHLCYFSVLALQPFFVRHGMRVYDAERLPIHAGSIRVWAGPIACGRQETDRLKDVLAEEQAAGLGHPQTFCTYGVRVAAHRTELRDTLVRLRQAGKRIAGYGAAARANTLLNYCQIGPDLVERIADDSPVRQNTFTPGMHIPVVHPDVLRRDPPDYILLLAWSFADEIMNRVRPWFAGQFIVPLPSVRISESKAAAEAMVPAVFTATAVPVCKSHRADEPVAHPDFKGARHELTGETMAAKGRAARLRLARP